MSNELNSVTPTLNIGEKLHTPKPVPSLESVLARPIVPLVSEHTHDDTDGALAPNRVREDSDDDPQRRLLQRLQTMPPKESDPTSDMYPHRHPQLA